ncbi:MAG: hypothetical protein FJ312_03270 [SAR202 cluster bacterium]|nr:hypothetical protein [SAR202 cluster bacterium]
MRPLIAITAGLFFAAVLLLPAFGPLLDHHFAERMPNHRHLNDAVAHTHGIERVHSHSHDGTQTPQDENDKAVPLVNADGAVGASIVLVQDLLAGSFDFEPSYGLLRSFGRSEAVTQTYTPPPKTPPKYAA